MTTPTDSDRIASATALEVRKLELERARYRADILKWIVVAIGAIVSFVVIDYGKLKLERFRVTADSQRQLLDSYLRATEAPQPDVWKRKLHILETFADDKRTKQWAETELKNIETFAGLDALYRETLKIASQLVEPGRLAHPDRVQARARFNQLYWADLPYAGESQKVIEAMIAFRQGLLEAEGAPKNTDAWDNLNRRLIELSRTLRESTPAYPGRQSPQPASKAGGG